MFNESLAFENNSAPSQILSLGLLFLFPFYPDGSPDYQASLGYEYAEFCMDTCGVPAATQADQRNNISSLTGQNNSDATLEAITTCDWLARNGFCHNGAYERLQLFTGNVAPYHTDERTFVMDWRAANVRANCAASCGLCQTSHAALDDYDQDANQFCSQTVPQHALSNSVAPASSSQAGDEYHAYAACILYTSCCNPDLVPTDPAAGQHLSLACTDRWPGLVTSALQSTNAFVNPSRCLMVNTQVPWQIVLYLVAATATLMLLAFACIRARWYLLWCRVRAVSAPKLAPARMPSMLDARSRSVEGFVHDHIRLDDVLHDAPQQLLGVNVSGLAEALDEAENDVASTEHVMAELWKGHRFLQRATDANGRPLGKLAIISYRCVTSDEDVFTLDAFALRSAVLAAQQTDVEYLWLDAWAYRKQPPWIEYEHGDFVRTLLAVMLRVEHVIWLPRSRLNAKGEYQFRIWCTFEAMIVHLRRLPVTVAGHGLDVRQVKLASEGAMLLSWPWEGGLLHATPLDNLGKVNAAFLVALIFQFSNVPYSIIRTWRSTAFADWAKEVGSEILFLIFLIGVHRFARAVLGRGVMSARNGQRVLVLMATAAAQLPAAEQLPATNEVDIEVPPAQDDSPEGLAKLCRGLHSAATRLRSAVVSLLPSSSVATERTVGSTAATLPWLSAFDRRDTMTIKMVLDDVERIVAAEGDVDPAQARARDSHGLHGLAQTSARNRRAETSSLGSKVPTAHWRRTHATACSILAHSRLIQSPGDKCDGMSLRSWLSAIGVTLYTGRERSLLLEDDDDGSLLVAPWCECFDTVLDMSKSATAAQSAGESSARSASAAESAEVAANRTWTATGTNAPVGITEVTATPAAIAKATASMFLAWARDTVAAAKDGVAKAKEAASIAMTTSREAGSESTTVQEPIPDGFCGADLTACGWRIIRGVDDLVETPAGNFALKKEGFAKGTKIRLDLDTQLAVPRLTITCMVSFYLMAVLSLTTTIRYLINDSSTDSRDSRSDLWISGWSSDIVEACQDLMWALMFAMTGVQKVRCDSSYGRFPVPLRGSGRLEYVAFWLLFVSLYFTVSLPKAGLSKTSIESSITQSDNMTIYGNHVEDHEMWFGFICRILHMAAISMLAAYEVVLALSHGLAAAARFRDARYLLAFTASAAEAKSRVA